MNARDGHIELDRAVDSIQVGRRHRTELGDLGSLSASIERDGLLQPITVTPDGILVCGARRLAAIKQLGWQHVKVWVRSGISGDLAHLLAEQDDNVLHKPLTQLESAALYREIKTLMAEDAARRQNASRFSHENQPGTSGDANFAAPSESLGDSRAQAASMIPDGASHTTLEKINYLQQLADDENQTESVREGVAAELELIGSGAPVHPSYERARQLVLEPMPESSPRPVPPIGVSISTDMERRSYGIRARARWTDPLTKQRVIRTEIVKDEATARAFFKTLRNSSVKGMDVSMTLLEFFTSIDDRWARGLDMTSTGDNYRYGLRLRVLPALGHLPVTQITAGMIDRTIDGWEKQYGASTIKNTIAPLVRVLDEAVRDGLITINPAKHRAKRSLHRNAFRIQPAKDAAPRAHAIPDLQKLNQLASACGDVHQSYSDFVMLAALLAARSSEVSGLQVGDVDFTKNLVIIRRQVFPGRGGLITKPTKSRKERRVPILDPLRPVLKRLCAFKQSDEPLLVGPRGGFLTTATVRDATSWDQVVADLGLPNLTRHGLRHTGATWLADAGVPLHVLQEILGHASIETTRGYLHPDDRHLASAAEQANAFLSRDARPKTPGRPRQGTGRGL